MIPNEKKKMALSCRKKLFALLHRKNSKHKGDFYFLNCLSSFRTENKLKSHEKVCKKKGFCGIVMPTEINKVSSDVIKMLKSISNWKHNKLFRKERNSCR